MPCPTIHETEEGSAFVLFSEVLKIYFSFGLAPEVICSSEDIDDSEVGRDHWDTLAGKKLMNELKKS